MIPRISIEQPNNSRSSFGSVRVWTKTNERLKLGDNLSPFTTGKLKPVSEEDYLRKLLTNLKKSPVRDWVFNGTSFKPSSYSKSEYTLTTPNPTSPSKLRIDSLKESAYIVMEGKESKFKSLYEKIFGFFDLLMKNK